MCLLLVYMGGPRKLFWSNLYFLHGNLQGTLYRVHGHLEVVKKTHSTHHIYSLYCFRSAMYASMLKQWGKHLKASVHHHPCKRIITHEWVSLCYSWWQWWYLSSMEQALGKKTHQNHSTGCRSGKDQLELQWEVTTQVSVVLVASLVFRSCVGLNADGATYG